MAKRSQLLEHRLDARLRQAFEPADHGGDVDALFSLVSSPARFDSREELHDHLREGALLNVGVIASKALSVPQGEYAVWMTDAGHTVLVPTSAPKGGDVVTGEAPRYDIHTNHLLGSWNRISRTIAETHRPTHNLTERQQGGGQAGQFGGNGGGSGGRKSGGDSGPKRQQDHYATAPDEQPEGPYTFGKKVARTELWQAMKDRNMGTSQLADAVGVDKSTISRLLRKVEKGQEEPGGRNPSAELATKISRVLGVPIDLVMPPESELIGKKRLGTSGSGKRGTMSSSRNGNQQVGQGAASESRDKLDGLIYHAAKLMSEMRIDPERYVKDHVPDRMVVLEFLGKWKKQPDPFDNAIGAMKDLASAYGSQGYSARMGDKKFGLGKFFSNVIGNLSKIKQDMPGVQSKRGGAAVNVDATDQPAAVASPTQKPAEDPNNPRIGYRVITKLLDRASAAQKPGSQPSPTIQFLKALQAKARRQAVTLADARELLGRAGGVNAKRLELALLRGLEEHMYRYGVYFLAEAQDAIASPQSMALKAQAAKIGGVDPASTDQVRKQMEKQRDLQRKEQQQQQKKLDPFFRDLEDTESELDGLQQTMNQQQAAEQEALGQMGEKVPKISQALRGIKGNLQ